MNALNLEFGPSESDTESDDLLVEFSADNPGAFRQLWEMIFFMAMCDNATQISYHPDRVNFILTYTVDLHNYELNPPPLEFRVQIIEQVRKFFKFGWWQSLRWRFRDRFSQGAFQANLRLDYKGEAHSVWSGHFWPINGVWGFEFVRISEWPEQRKLRIVYEDSSIANPN